jgi:hypothetical protein
MHRVPYNRHEAFRIDRGPHKPYLMQSEPGRIEFRLNLRI